MTRSAARNAARRGWLEVTGLLPLDSRLLLAKVFSPDEDDLDMRHALVRRRYPEHLAAAERIPREAAIDQFLNTYLGAAVYAVPKVLAKHLGIPETELRAGVARLEAHDQM